MEEQEETVEISYLRTYNSCPLVRLFASIKELIMYKFVKSGYKGDFDQSGEVILASCEVTKGKKYKTVNIEFTHQMISVEIVLTGGESISIKNKSLFPNSEQGIENCEELIGEKIDSVIDVLKIKLPEVFS